MSTLDISRNKVNSIFDKLSSKPAEKGVIGVVGVTDKSPQQGSLIGIKNISELSEVLGKGSLVSLNQVLHALNNETSRIIVSPVHGGAPGRADLINSSSDKVITLLCRFNRDWRKSLKVKVKTALNEAKQVCNITVHIILNNEEFETFFYTPTGGDDIDNLINIINSQSQIITAIDCRIKNNIPNPGMYSLSPCKNTINIKGAANKLLFQIVPADKILASSLNVTLYNYSPNTVTLEVYKEKKLLEKFCNLSMDPDNCQYLPYILTKESNHIRIKGKPMEGSLNTLPAETIEPVIFTNGLSPSLYDIKKAISLLEKDVSIELVLAIIEPTRSDIETIQIHQALLSHSVSMFEIAPRIAFGSSSEDGYRHNKEWKHILRA